jgi:nucleotide-binding universal stress UspA family protein
MAGARSWCQAAFATPLHPAVHVARLRASDVNVTPDTRPGDPDSVIPQVVAEAGAGLVVMGAHGHARFREFMVGSTTTKLLQTSAAPLLVVR